MSVDETYHTIYQLEIYFSVIHPANNRDPLAGAFPQDARYCKGGSYIFLQEGILLKR